MSDTVYVGNGWPSKFGVRIQLKREKLKELPVDKYGNIFLELCERKEKDERSGATHYVKVDDYSYEHAMKKQSGASEQPAEAVNTAEQAGPQKDDLPF